MSHPPLAPLSSTESSCDVLVIGAGIVGVSIASYLRRDGRDVLLVDRDHVAGHTTTLDLQPFSPQRF